MKGFKLLALLLVNIALVGGEPRPVVLITGASRGVGLEAAKHFAKHGYEVFGTVRPEYRGELPSEHGLHFVPINLFDELSIRSGVEKILEKTGRIDLLINNAGYALAGPLEALTREEIEEQLQINFMAPLLFIQSVLPTMREQKRGHIINISSTNAVVTPPYGGLYAASKAALESVSESLSVEVGSYGIAVSIVEPGLLSTNFSILMGSKRVSEDPYREVIEEIKTALKERHELSGQSSEEVAAFLFAIAQDPKPKLRYQTSQEAREEVATKLISP